MKILYFLQDILLFYFILEGGDRLRRRIDCQSCFGVHKKGFPAGPRVVQTLNQSIDLHHDATQTGWRQVQGFHAGECPYHGHRYRCVCGWTHRLHHQK